jgi:hypothetical protein
MSDILRRDSDYGFALYDDPRACGSREEIHMKEHIRMSDLDNRVYLFLDPTLAFGFDLYFIYDLFFR